MFGVGYTSYRLSNKGKYKTVYIHRLVAEYFLDDFHQLKEVHHIDENKLNNHVDNLQVVTRSENMIEVHKNRKQYIYKKDFQFKLFGFDIYI